MITIHEGEFAMVLPQMSQCSNEIVVYPDPRSKGQSFTPLSWSIKEVSNFGLLEKKTANIPEFVIDSLIESPSRATIVDEVAKLSETVSTISTVDDVLDTSKKCFPSRKQYLFDSISEVMADFYSEEDNVPISVDSLKGMLLFLFSLKEFKEPSISISDEGLFYLDWEKSLNDSLTVRFKNHFILEYSLFQPGLHTKKLAIRNGRIPVLDFEADLRKLGIKTYK